MDKQNLVLKHERLDDLHINNLKIIQDANLFCFGIDSVILSDFAKVSKGDKVLDLGTGTGIIPILLTAKSLGGRFIGLEIQPTSVNIARRSVQYNNLEHLIDIVQGDIKEMHKIFKNMCFDVITTNPPYTAFGNGLTNSCEAKCIARHEILCNLEDIISGSSKVLRCGASFFMIHKPHRLTDIVFLMRKYKIEPKLIRFVQPYSTKEPNMVLIKGIKNGKPWTQILPPLICYNDNGSYSDEINSIYNINKKS